MGISQSTRITHQRLQDIYHPDWLVSFPVESMLSSMRAIGYARVSTDKQADKGISLEIQQEKIRAMVVVQGAELIDIIVDGGESAKNLNRPGMLRLLAMADAREIDAVIIAKLDRLTRRSPSSLPGQCLRTAE